MDTVKCASKDLKTSTGVLFSNQSVESLFDAVSWFEEKKIYEQLSSELINHWAQKFRPEVFSTRFQSAIQRAWEGHLKSSLCCSFK